VSYDAVPFDTKKQSPPFLALPRECAMCGRARASMAAAAAARAAGVPEERWRDRERYQPRYNAAPGAWLPVVRTARAADEEAEEDAAARDELADAQHDGDAAREDDHAHAADAPHADDAPRERLLQARRAFACLHAAQHTQSILVSRAVCRHLRRCRSQTMRWGLVPSYKRKEEAPNYWRMFNCRSDTAADKPVFGRLLSRRRCVVLLNGFYEWRLEGTRGAGRVKQPYYLHAAPSNEGDATPAADAAAETEAENEDDARVLRVAGLYDRWEGPEGPLYTCTILTTDSAPQLRWLHDRMPVILPDDAAVAAWLEGDAHARTLRQVSRPEAAPALAWRAVSTGINNAAEGAEGPGCCVAATRAAEKDTGSVAALFARAGGGSGVKRAAEADAEDAAAEGEAWAAEGSAHAPRPDGGAAAQEKARAGNGGGGGAAPAAPMPLHAQQEGASPAPASARKRPKPKAATPLPKGQRSLASFFTKQPEAHDTH
jgi:putative SOS response-associated peptidase YedK